MKKLISILLSALLIISIVCSAPLAVSAAIVNSGTTGDCTWTLDGEGTLTISGNGEMADYSQEYVNGSYVPTAPWGANINSVVIENGVTKIGEYAFDHCAELKSASIPGSVTEICDCAFEYCSGLSEITIPKGVNSIGHSAFMDCSGLKSVIIPDGVTEVGYHSFYQCVHLTSVTVPASVENIGYKAFGLFEDDDYFLQRVSGFAIYGVNGSKAEQYANMWGLLFVGIQPHNQFFVGDINGDTSIDVLDALMIHKYAVDKIELTDEEKYLADVNNDNVVDILDALDIQKYAVNKLTGFTKKA